MAEDKKLVEAITSMDVDFAQWYTDVCKKAELMSYSSVKGCMIFKPAGYAIWEKQVLRMYTFLCLFQKVFLKRKRIM